MAWVEDEVEPFPIFFLPWELSDDVSGVETPGGMSTKEGAGNILFKHAASSPRLVG